MQIKTIRLTELNVAYSLAKVLIAMALLPVGVTLGCNEYGLKDDPAVVRELIELGVVTEENVNLGKKLGADHISKLELRKEGLAIEHVLPLLPQLHKLENLRLSVKDLDAAATEPLAKLTDMIRLDLHGCRDEHLALCQGMRGLQELDVSSSSVTDNGLANLADLTALRRLELRGNPLTGRGLNHLSRLVELRELNLESTNLEDDAIVHIVTNFPKLEKLFLNRTDVSAEAIYKLAEKPSLLVIAYPTDLFRPRFKEHPDRTKAEVVAEANAALTEFRQRCNAIYFATKEAARERGKPVPEVDYGPFGRAEDVKPQVE